MRRRRVIKLPTKKRRKGHGKGAAFERRVCEILSMWCTGMTRQDLFWRSAMSGGRARVKTRKARSFVHFGGQAGDISAIHPLGHHLLSHFLVECKSYLDLKTQSLVFGSMGLAGQFFVDNLKLANKTGRHLMLIMKQNRIGEVVFLSRLGYEYLEQCVRRDGETIHPLPVQATFPQIGATVVLLRDLVSDVNYSKFRKVFPQCEDSLLPTSTSPIGRKMSIVGRFSSGSVRKRLLARRRISS